MSKSIRSSTRRRRSASAIPSLTGKSFMSSGATKLDPPVSQRSHHVFGWPPLHPDCCTMLFFSDDEGWGRLFANSPQDRANTTCRCSFEHGKQLIFYLIFYLISVIFINYIYNSIYLTFFCRPKGTTECCHRFLTIFGKPTREVEFLWIFVPRRFTVMSQLGLLNAKLSS